MLLVLSPCRRNNTLVVVVVVVVLPPRGCRSAPTMGAHVCVAATEHHQCAKVRVEIRNHLWRREPQKNPDL